MLVILDDIEILDWVENSVKKSCPVPMCDLELTAYDDYLFIVGYMSEDMYFGTVIANS